MKYKICERIAEMRMAKNLKQSELADMVGVSAQAVSKWESLKCYPDLELLPKIAEIFGCSIDELFGIDSPKADAESEMKTVIGDLPWEDDGVIRGVVYEGRKLLKCENGDTERFTFELVGNAKNVEAHCNLHVEGDVDGNAQCGMNTTVEGDVGGSVKCGMSAEIGGDVGGTASAGMSINVDGDVGGSVSSGMSVAVGGDINGDVTTSGAVTVGGDLNGNIKKAAYVTVEGDANGDISCDVFQRG